MRILKSGGSSSGVRRRRWTLRRVGMWAVCLLVGAVIAGELGARYIMGLGDPPLFLLDPEIEYLLKPDQKCRRFGHDYAVNSHSMRSEEFAARKPAGEFRVMVIGDSLMNGGGKIDQSELATTILRRELAKAMKREVVVGNISAPSWGPPNQLAFVKKYGVFDADVVVIVNNSDDWDDVPGLEYIGSAWPREKPMSALTELFGVYGWKALCKGIGRAAEPPPPTRAATHEQDVERCRVAYGELVAAVRASGAKVAEVQWLKLSEVRGSPQPGFVAIGEWAASAGLRPVTSGKGLQSLVSSAPAQDFPYQAGDDIHPSAAGHVLLARLLKAAVEEAVSSETGASVGKPPAAPDKSDR